MTTPDKYQYQRRVDADEFDAARITQTDTGAASVLRPVVVLGDSETGEYVGGGKDPSSGIPALMVQSVTLDLMLEEMKKVNEGLFALRRQLNLITELEDLDE